MYVYKYIYLYMFWISLALFPALTVRIPASSPDPQGWTPV